MSKPELTKCPLCGGSVRLSEISQSFSKGRRSVKLTGTFRTCDVCGEIFFAKGELDAALRAASDRIREQDGLLKPEEILAIRSRLAMTQPEFEMLLGVGPKTVVRWERGTVFQNAATDTLIRLIRDVPEAVSYLRRRHLAAQIERGATGRLVVRRRTPKSFEFSYVARVQESGRAPTPITAAGTVVQEGTLGDGHATTSKIEAA